MICPACKGSEIELESTADFGKVYICLDCFCNIMVMKSDSETKDPNTDADKEV